MGDTTRRADRISRGAGFFLASAALLMMGGIADAATYKGAAVHIGKGTARIVIQTDKSGKPSSVAVMMTPCALQGLPAILYKKSAEGSWEFSLPLPKHGPKAGYTHVLIRP